MAKRSATEVPPHGSPEVGPWMEKWGIPVTPESEHFMDNARAKGTTWKDWSAAWRNWQRMSAKFAKERGGSGGSSAGGAWGSPWKSQVDNPNLNKLPEFRDYPEIERVDPAVALAALNAVRLKPVPRRGSYGE